MKKSGQKQKGEGEEERPASRRQRLTTAAMNGGSIADMIVSASRAGLSVTPAEMKRHLEFLRAHDVEVWADDEQWQPAAWLLQVPPDDPDWLKNCQPGNGATWEAGQISRYHDQMRPGDPIFIWQTGPASGLYAEGRLVSSPYPHPAGNGRQVIDLLCTRRIDPPLLRRSLRQNPLFKESPSIQRSTGRLFPLTTEQVNLFSSNLSPSPDLTATPSTSTSTLIEAGAEKQTSPRSLSSKASSLLLQSFPPSPVPEPDTGEAKVPISYNPDPLLVRGNLEIASGTITQLVNLLASGKHVILSGPPGTGKTTLALNAARAAVQTGYSHGYILTTATADWTTFDTVGGLSPDERSTLRFSEGLFLRAIAENKWLICDEINRCDVDKAFGQLLTVLSGQAVELPFYRGGRRISLDFSDSPHSFYDPLTATYRIGKHWRVLGTLNSFDKNALFTLSYAFLRRFAFVNITNPPLRLILEAALTRHPEATPFQPLLLTLLDPALIPRPLGPASIIDIVAYLGTQKQPGPPSLLEALAAFALPQFEGASTTRLENWFNTAARRSLPQPQLTILAQHLNDLFDLPLPRLNTTPLPPPSSGPDRDKGSGRPPFSRPPGNLNEQKEEYVIEPEL